MMYTQHNWIRTGQLCVWKPSLAIIFEDNGSTWAPSLFTFFTEYKKRAKEKEAQEVEAFKKHR